MSMAIAPPPTAVMAIAYAQRGKLLAKTPTWSAEAQPVEGQPRIELVQHSIPSLALPSYRIRVQASMLSPGSTDPAACSLPDTLQYISLFVRAWLQGQTGPRADVVARLLEIILAGCFVHKHHFVLQLADSEARAAFEAIGSFSLQISADSDQLTLQLSSSSAGREHGPRYLPRNPEGWPGAE